MKIKVSFLTADDTPPDLILAFAQIYDSIGSCKSLILMRTKMYEKLKYEFERGVSISWEDDVVNADEFDEIITSFEWNKTRAIITTPKRTFEVDISNITKGELRDMEKILKKMNSDNCFKLRKI